MLNCSTAVTNRGEVAPDEDLALLNAQALLQRPASLAFVALIAILDPPRDEAIQAVKVAHDAGITVKMITGECGSLTSRWLHSGLGHSGICYANNSMHLDVLGTRHLGQ
jgi:hypothetical protein